MATDDEIIEKYDEMPFTDEDDICQHKGEPYHRHKKYNGKEHLPYDELRANRELRIKRLMLAEARAEGYKEGTEAERKVK
jgi:hypothetical protein